MNGDANADQQQQQQQQQQQRFSQRNGMEVPKEEAKDQRTRSPNQQPMPQYQHTNQQPQNGMDSRKKLIMDYLASQEPESLSPHEIARTIESKGEIRS